MVIGIGTGSLYRYVDPASRMAVKSVELSGSDTIELCGVKSGRIQRGEKNSFFNFSRRDLGGFDYVSLHAPVDIEYNGESETRRTFERIGELHEKLGFDLVVFHPERFTDEGFELLRKYEFPIGFENMDSHKDSMKTVSDITSVLERDDRFGFVLDFTHAFSVDHSGKLASDFIRAHGERVRQVHLSGYRTHGEDHQDHFPMHLEKETYGISFPLPHQVILENAKQVLRTNPEIPVIIESVFPHGLTGKYQDSLKSELDYVKRELDVV